MSSSHICMKVKSESHSVVSNSLRPHGQYSPWNSPGHTGVGSLSILWGIFPTQRLNPGLPHCRWILLPTDPQGSAHMQKRGCPVFPTPFIGETVFFPLCILGSFLISQLITYLLLLWLSWKLTHLQCGRPGFNPWVGKIP